MTVQLQSNGDYWKAVWYDSKGVRKSKSLGSKASVKKRAALKLCTELAVRMSLQPGARDAGRAPALAHWLDRYYDMRDDLKDNTMALHRETGVRLIDFFGADTRIDTITRGDAADWRTALGRELKEPTVCRHVRTAKTIFNRAVDEDRLVSNPFNKLRGTPPEPDQDWPIISDDDMWCLVGHCRTWGWGCLVGLCGFAGLRRSEALILEWSDIDWDRNRIRVRNPDDVEGTKKKARDVFMEPDLRRLLDMAWWHTGWGRRVCRVPVNNLHRDMNKIIADAGFVKWRKPFHTLRKSRATQWECKYPAFVVNAWIGNSMAVAAKHYRRVPEDFYVQ